MELELRYEANVGQITIHKPKEDIVIQKCNPIQANIACTDVDSKDFEQTNDQI